MPEDRASRLPASPGALAVRYVPWPEMASDIDNWDRLASQAAEPNPFFESWYLLPSFEAFDPEKDLSVLRFEQDGALCGLLPIRRQSRYYGWPIPNLSSWVHENCFLGTPLIARGYEIPFWQAFLGWADANAGSALFLHMRDMPLDGHVHAALLSVLAKQSRQIEIVHREERALLASHLSAEEYWNASLSAKKRKELRRQAKRLAEQGQLAFVTQTDNAGIHEWTEQFLALEAAGWKGEAGSALACEAATSRLFRQSLNGAAERGKLERLALTLDGRPIAMLATFLTPPGSFSFKTAFDEAYARFSPGVLLQQENLSSVLDRTGIDWSDSCASADHPMIDHIWRERRPIGRISIAIGGAIRRIAFNQIVRAELARKSAGMEP